METGVSDYVLALTILAVGTSWPDLIASKIAAKHLPTADSAIANINARSRAFSFPSYVLKSIDSFLCFRT